MPTVLRSGPYRFFFYSDEGSEPVHVHIEREDKVAKYWMQPVSLASAGDFSKAELRRLERLVIQHQDTIIQSWNEHFAH